VFRNGRGGRRGGGIAKDPELKKTGTWLTSNLIGLPTWRGEEGFSVKYEDHISLFEIPKYCLNQAAGRLERCA
jgi:hypothetical protein